MLRKPFLATKVTETIKNLCFCLQLLGLFKKKTCKYLTSEIYSDLSCEVDH